MKRLSVVFTVVALLTLTAAGAAFAHTPICSCFLNGDGTITCEGGFSDGSSAAGTAIRVVDTDQQVLVEGEMDDFGTFTFETPEIPFVVIFDAGPGHQVKVEGEEIQ